MPRRYPTLAKPRKMWSAYRLQCLGNRACRIEARSCWEWTFDNEIRRCVAERIVRSNGITRTELGNAAGELTVEVLKGLAERSREAARK